MGVGWIEGLLEVGVGSQGRLFGGSGMDLSSEWEGAGGTALLAAELAGAKAWRERRKRVGQLEHRQGGEVKNNQRLDHGLLQATWVLGEQRNSLNWVKLVLQVSREWASWVQEKIEGNVKLGGGLEGSAGRGLWACGQVFEPCPQAMGSQGRVYPNLPHKHICVTTDLSFFPFFFSFMVVKVRQYKTYSFKHIKLYSSAAPSTFTLLCNFHHRLLNVSRS